MSAQTVLHTIRLSVFALAVVLLPGLAVAESVGSAVCPRLNPGSAVSTPKELKSVGGVLRVRLSLRRSVELSGGLRYCYLDENGNQAPTLRVKPGDLLILKLKNEVPVNSISKRSSTHERVGGGVTSRTDVRLRSMPETTNLHFHGLMIPPARHQDDVLRTSIEPGAAYYEYRVRIPKAQPPGLYWYHPHAHGHSEEQVLGGASGALIVEGIENFNSAVAGLPERLVVIRDQTRPSTKPDAGPKPPSKDLSVNFVPVTYPDFQPAVVTTKPSEREFWRVLNASADTFVDLHLLTGGRWQSLGLVSLDGVPLSYEQAGRRGKALTEAVEWTQNILIPPGGRAEFLFDSAPEGVVSQLLAAGFDTVPFVDEDDRRFSASNADNASWPDDDDYTPPRWLITILSAQGAALPDSVLPEHSADVALITTPSGPPLESVRPTRQRKLYFSEKVKDPKNPRTSTDFLVTEDGKVPAVFDPAAPPNITVRQGDVEDWIIENRSQEAHTFHIHQVHFMVLERENKTVQEDYLRDTIDLPFWDGVSPEYPSVKLRIDFRDPAIIGTFPYHCHILQHEDGGMMGTVRVLKRVASQNEQKIKLRPIN